MAQGLKVGLGIPLWAGYAISSLMIIPLVIYGMKLLSNCTRGPTRCGW